MWSQSETKVRQWAAMCVPDRVQGHRNNNKKIRNAKIAMECFKMAMANEGVCQNGKIGKNSEMVSTTSYTHSTHGPLYTYIREWTLNTWSLRIMYVTMIQCVYSVFSLLAHFSHSIRRSPKDVRVRVYKYKMALPFLSLTIIIIAVNLNGNE